MILRNLPIAAWLLAAAPLAAQNGKPWDTAAAFGARASVTHMRLSPDGASVAYVSPGAGQGSVVYTLSLVKGSAARPVLSASGNPDRIARCDWVSNQRLVCEVYGVTKQNPALQAVTFSRLVAVNADGSNPKVLSTRENAYSRGWLIGGGGVIDWLPEEDGAALIQRVHLADDHLGTKLANTRQGLAVDWIDTRSLAVKSVEQPHEGVVDYLSDGHGTVRVMAM
jgi:hypothetical protein